MGGWGMPRGHRRQRYFEILGRWGSEVMGRSEIMEDLRSQGDGGLRSQGRGMLWT